MTELSDAQFMGKSTMPASGPASSELSDAQFLGNDAVQPVTVQSSTGTAPSTVNSPNADMTAHPILSKIENFFGLDKYKPANVTGQSAPNDTRNPAWAAVADIPSEIKSAALSAAGTINANLNPFSAENEAYHDAQANNPDFIGGLGSELQHTLGTGAGLLAIPSLVASPITGASRSVIGHGLAATLPGETYEQGKADADQLMSAIRAKTGATPPVIPPNPAGPFGVIKSAGQATGDIGQIQDEYSAAMGNLGPRAQKVAQAFIEQQKEQLDAAQTQVASSLSPTMEIIAETPQDAGNIISKGVQSAAQAAKNNVTAKYTEAKSLPGEIDASAFIGERPNPGTDLGLSGESASDRPLGPTIGDSIRSALSAGDDPVIIDDKLTPIASAAIQDLDRNASKLIIQNRADPIGSPSADQITGVSLAGIEQWRKRLSILRGDALNGSNGSDKRAMKAVIDAFDNHIDNAVNSGLFTGDPMAVQAWNDARAANADYRSTFTAGKSDPVGRVVQRIIGDRTNDPAIGNDVADFMYGGSGTNPNSLNVAVANRIKSIFGEQSPVWTSFKQGLFNRLTKPTPGSTKWGSQKISSNIDKFLNGDGQEMANAVLSPAEREMIKSYGDLHQSLIPPPGATNPSGTSPFVVKAMNAMGSHVGEFAGAALGHMMLPGLPEIVSAPLGAGVAKGASVASQAMQARKIAKAMPATATAMRDWQRAVAKAQGNYGPDMARALGYTSARLSNALRPFGITLQQVLASIGVPQGPATANAGQDQQNIVWPPSQQHNGGNAANENGFAHGGRVVVNPKPTEAQKAVGNYKKGHIRIHGLNVTIENPKGSYREGVGKDGKKWRVKMPNDYGYVRGTIGADHDHLDVHIGPHENSDKVFVIDQRDLDTRKFDEHKVFLGFRNREAAIGGYCNGFSDGKGSKRIMKITPMTVDEFKAWLDSGNTKEPLQSVA